MNIEVKFLKEVCSNPSEHCVKVLEVKGNLDRSNVEDFKKNVLQYFDTNPAKIILDFKGVDFCDSTGLTGLIELTNKANETKGFFRLIAVSDKIKQILQMLGLNVVINVFETLDEAAVN